MYDSLQNGQDRTGQDPEYFLYLEAALTSTGQRWTQMRCTVTGHDGFLLTSTVRCMMDNPMASDIGERAKLVREMITLVPAMDTRVIEELESAAAAHGACIGLVESAAAHVDFLPRGCTTGVYPLHVGFRPGSLRSE